MALRRAGPAIIASAATVVVGMLCLLAAETNSTRSLGPVAAIGVAVALLVMVTLLPALLVICGRWLFWPIRPHVGSAEPTTRGILGPGRQPDRPPAAARSGWRPRWCSPCWRIGVVQLDANGLTNAESFPGKPDSVVGEEVVARHFPTPGEGNPVAVVAGAQRRPGRCGPPSPARPASPR